MYVIYMHVAWFFPFHYYYYNYLTYNYIRDLIISVQVRGKKETSIGTVTTYIRLCKSKVNISRE